MTYQQYPPQQYGYPQQYAAPAGPTWSQQRFVGHFFKLRQKILSLGNQYYIYDPNGATIGFVHQKLLTLREDIRIFTDESMAYEMMRVRQEQIIDFSGSFQVVDSQSGELIGILRRKGLHSMFKDEWQILNRNRQEIGLIKERGGITWFLRRFILKWIPYKYDIFLYNNPVGEVSEKFELFGDTYMLDLSKDPNYSMDRRLAIVCCLMMDIGEHE